MSQISTLLLIHHSTSQTIQTVIAAWAWVQLYLSQKCLSWKETPQNKVTPFCTFAFSLGLKYSVWVLPFLIKSDLSFLQNTGNLNVQYCKKEHIRAEIKVNTTMSNGFQAFAIQPPYFPELGDGRSQGRAMWGLHTRKELWGDQSRRNFFPHRSCLESAAVQLFSKLLNHSSFSNRTCSFTHWNW